MPHREIELSSAACRSDAVRTELQFRPITQDVVCRVQPLKRSLLNIFIKKKICTRRIPHQLSKKQKTNKQTKKHRRNSVTCSKKLLGMCRPERTKRPCDIMIVDETWMTFYGILNKRFSQKGMDKNELRPVLFRTGFQSRKQCIFNSSCPVAIDVLPGKNCTDSTYYA